MSLADIQLDAHADALRLEVIAELWRFINEHKRNDGFRAITAYEREVSERVKARAGAEGSK